jgi:membrane protein DedA with SNARE-associated domain
VFFGSALHDFGVEPFLQGAAVAGAGARAAGERAGRVEPARPDFSGFVFKIQANMNPRHRDRVAFLRICSGRLTKDMLVTTRGSATTLRLSRVYRFFGRDRETVPEAYPGDVVGLVNPGQLAIGDTLYAGAPCASRRFRSSRPSGSPTCGRPTCGTSASTRPSGSSPKKACCRCSCRAPGRATRSSGSSARCSSTSSRRGSRPSTASMIELAAAPDLLQTWGYPALFLLLLLTAVGSPVPEDLLLAATGYLIYTGVFAWTLAAPIAFSGVVGSDVVLYTIGRHVGDRTRRRLEARVLSPRRVRLATRWFARFGPSAVFVARLVPGTRTLVFVTAGLSGLPRGQFVAYDMLGAAVWVPLVLLLGYLFGAQIGDLGNVVSWVQRRAIWVIAIVLLLLAVWLVWGREESKL